MVENGHRAQGIARLPFAHPDGEGAFVEVLWLEELRQRTTYEPSRVDFHCLQIVTRGSGFHFIDFERVPIQEGELLLTSEGQVHWFDRDSTYDAHVIVFRSEALSTTSPRLLAPLRPQAFPLASPDRTAVEDLVTIMANTQRTDSGMGSQRAMRHLLSAVLVCAERASPDAGISRAHALVRLLDDHVASKRDVDWYATTLGVSTRTLSRMCEQEFGVSAKTYIDRRVVLEAKRLLVHTDWTVGAIGAHLHFAESTNFVKFFRRVEGVPPRGFRERVK